MILLGTGIQRAAKSSRVDVGGQILTYASFTADATVGDLPTNNFTGFSANNPAFAGSGGASYDEGISGILKSAWTCGGDWDAGTNPIDVSAVAPPGLYPRDDLENLNLWINVPDATLWNYPYARVRSSNTGGQVDGAVTFTASGMNQGEFIFPTGSV